MILKVRLYQRVLLVCLLLSQNLFAGQSGEKNGNAGILVSAKVGTSIMVTEIHRDLSGMVSEFNHQPGLHYEMEVSGFITFSLEAGVGLSHSFLKGHAENPDFSAIGYQYFMEQPPEGPMQYTNRLYGPEVFVRYHFKNFRQQPELNVFLETGVGLLFYESELFYSDRSNGELIFGKRRGKFADYNMSNVAYTLGGGLHYSLSDRIGLKIAANMNVVGYDFLDVVHNFKPGGNRREVLGVFSDFTAGIVINLRKQKSSVKGKKSGSNKHLPFSGD